MNNEESKEKLKKHPSVRAKTGRSKYKPHVGKKQLAKLARK
jgi:hypothetical protein